MRPVTCVRDRRDRVVVGDSGSSDGLPSSTTPQSQSWSRSRSSSVGSVGRSRQIRGRAAAASIETDTRATPASDTSASASSSPRRPSATSGSRRSCCSSTERSIDGQHHSPRRGRTHPGSQPATPGIDRARGLCIRGTWVCMCAGSIDPRAVRGSHVSKPVHIHINSTHPPHIQHGY